MFFLFFLFRYLLSENHSTNFAIDSATGQIVTTVQLDREQQDKYELEVIAMDSRASNPLSSKATVTVIVDDENDHQPTFEKEVIIVYIQNPSPAGKFSL